ncbi:ribosome biogenesis protein SSF1 [Myxozyma melibiosi]|uniref:Ribosome biogenesis protein SSF1 n=1 Tax=Myxozyma melibiosi TaxID=54550 RepID=A0ABR1F6M8_9ASCO
MVKRRTKNRTHVAQPNPVDAGIPQSMVLRIGGSSVGVSLSQLVLDVRTVMQPHTAVKLRERKANKLKDYLTMAGPLGVSHLLLFAKSQSNETTLRIAHTPRGPTIHFRVQSYSLCKDIRRVQRHPRTLGPDALESPPLLVLNGFQPPPTAENATDKAHLKLMTSMFQNMFPAITASASALKKIKRVMLVNFDQESGEVDIRHYLISTKTLTKPGRKIKMEIKNEEEDASSKDIDMADFEDEANDRDAGSDDDSDAEEEDDDEDESEDEDKFLPSAPSTAARAKLQKLLLAKKRLSRKLPHLGASKDIADYVLREDAEMSAVTSESEAEDDDLFDGSILNNGPVRKGSSKAEKKAVKLIEVGPRMRLKLIKIQDGVCEGDVLYHAFRSAGPAPKRAKKSKKEKKEKKERAKEEEE